MSSELYTTKDTQSMANSFKDNILHPATIISLACLLVTVTISFTTIKFSVTQVAKDLQHEKEVREMQGQVFQSQLDGLTTNQKATIALIDANKQELEKLKEDYAYFKGLSGHK